MLPLWGSTVSASPCEIKTELSLRFAILLLQSGLLSKVPERQISPAGVSGAFKNTSVASIAPCENPPIITFFHSNFIELIILKTFSRIPVSSGGRFSVQSPSSSLILIVHQARPVHPPPMSTERTPLG